MIQSNLGRGAFSIVLTLLIAAAILISSCEPERTIESTLAADDALYLDHFDPSTLGNWYVESDEIGESAIENEGLIIRVNSPNTIQYSTLREPLFDDFRLQIDIASLDGSEAVSYGVLFRMNEQNEFYRFDITGDGRFMVEKANTDGSWTRFLNDWKRAESIQTGRDTWNSLRVDAVGSEMSFYVNNILVFNMTDDALSVGHIGLDIGAFDQPSASAAFDNLIIHSP